MRATSTLRSLPALGLPRTVRGVLSDAISAADSGSTPSASGACASTSASGLASPATVHGWVRSVRAHKNVAFAEVDDGSGAAVQAVLKGKGRADGLTLGSSVRLTGQLTPSRGAGQAYELQVSDAEVLGACDPDAYPIQKKALPAPVLREQAHLRFRTGMTGSVVRVRDALARDWHDWFEDNEFVHVHTPILTSSDCEGAGEVFTVAQSLPGNGSPSPLSESSAGSATASTTSSTDTKVPFFPRPVNLTVSGQLHLEAPTHALSRTYTLSPCFRAEPSMTSRHLAEFYMLEAEVAFVRDLPSLLDVVERCFRSVLVSLLNSPRLRATRARADLARIARLRAAEPESTESTEGSADASDPLAHIRAAASAPFARLRYSDAIALLERQHAVAPFAHAPEWSQGLTSEHEKWLAGEYFSRPVFVTDYPATLKPFYMLPSASSTSDAVVVSDLPPDLAPTPDPAPTVAAFDLLFPGIGEMAGGSLREHRLDTLLAAIREHGLREDEYTWYLDLRRFGSVPHGGWGMGWERWVCWVTGVGNVRDVVAFPRWAGSCRF